MLTLPLKYCNIIMYAANLFNVAQITPMVNTVVKKTLSFFKKDLYKVL